MEFHLFSCQNFHVDLEIMAQRSEKCGPTPFCLCHASVHNLGYTCTSYPISFLTAGRGVDCLSNTFQSANATYIYSQHFHIFMFHSLPSSHSVNSHHNTINCFPSRQHLGKDLDEDFEDIARSQPHRSADQAPAHALAWFISASEWTLLMALNQISQ